jgi:hypothetical protein
LINRIVADITQSFYTLPILFGSPPTESEQVLASFLQGRDASVDLPASPTLPAGNNPISLPAGLCLAKGYVADH